MGGTLDITKFGESVVAMDIMGIVTGLFALIAVGFVVVALASRYNTIKDTLKKSPETVGMGKY